MGRYCRGCRYDLGGLAPSAGGGGALCPECGRRFNQSDRRTTLASPSLWRRPWVVRVARSCALLSLLLVVFWLTWLPRPMDSRWRSWVWLGKEYSTTRVTTAASRLIELRVRADVAVSLVGFTDSGDMAFRVRRIGADRLRLEVQSTDVTWNEVAGAMRRMDAVASRVAFAGGDAGARPAAAFVVEGGVEEVAEEVVERFDLRPAVVVRRLGADDWEVDLREASVSIDEVFGAFNALRDHIYGVRSTNAPAPWEVRPFRVRGTESDCFWRIMNEFGRSVDRPDLVPATSEGWHPTGVFSPSPRPVERRREVREPSRIRTLRPGP